MNSENAFAKIIISSEGMKPCQGTREGEWGIRSEAGN